VTHLRLAERVLVAAESAEVATFTLSEEPCADGRAITVPSIEAALDRIAERIERWPIAAAVCDDVLRAFDDHAPTMRGVLTESLAYSTLQSGPEFARWLGERGPATVPELPDPVLAERLGDTLRVRFNRPQRHNAFSTDARGALLQALEVARLDPSVAEFVLTGNGPSCCSGGDLAEFGTARRWCSIRSPRAWAGTAGRRSTARSWAVASRWRRSAGTSPARAARRWGCRSWRWASFPGRAAP